MEVFEIGKENLPEIRPEASTKKRARELHEGLHTMSTWCFDSATHEDSISLEIRLTVGMSLLGAECCDENVFATSVKRGTCLLCVESTLVRYRRRCLMIGGLLS